MAEIRLRSRGNFRELGWNQPMFEPASVGYLETPHQQTRLESSLPEGACQRREGKASSIDPFAGTSRIARILRGLGFRRVCGRSLVVTAGFDGRVAG